MTASTKYTDADIAASVPQVRPQAPKRTVNTCRWFMLCDNPAVATEPHPILGNVPICQRCVDKLNSMKDRC